MTKDQNTIYNISSSQLAKAVIHTVPLITIMIILLLSYTIINQPTKQQTKAIEIKLPSLFDPSKIALDTTLLKNQRYILHVFSSWCSTCHKDLELLSQIQKTLQIPIYGINWNDDRDSAMAWLKTQPHIPYKTISFDYNNTAKQLRIKHVPDTIIINKNGTIDSRGSLQELLK